MSSMIRAAVMVAAIAFGGVTLPSPAAVADAAGPVLLTVAGEVSKPNRGAMDPFLDGILNANNQAFAKAATFALADLNALPQVEISASAEGWPAAAEDEGRAARRCAGCGRRFRPRRDDLRARQLRREAVA